MAIDDMALPEGCTCEDCRTFDWCKQLGVIQKPNQTHCDWAPSRFAFSAVKATKLREQLAAAKARIARLKLCVSDKARRNRRAMGTK